MVDRRPTIVLVHGAFAESASWNEVVARLQAHSCDVVAVANPLRSVDDDAAYLRDVIAALGGRVVLAGHSYGGMVITEAAAGNDRVLGLVYVAAFTPEHGKSAAELSGRLPRPPSPSPSRRRSPRPSSAPYRTERSPCTPPPAGRRNGHGDDNDPGGTFPGPPCVTTIGDAESESMLLLGGAGLERQDRTPFPGERAPKRL